MKLEELELFRRAAALGALSRAGRELGLSPAAASARLQSLEKSLGATLFARSTRRLALTEEGQLLLSHVERALDELETARTTMREGRATPAGLLRATVPGPFSLKHVLPFVREFLELYPEIRLDLDASDDVKNLTEHGYEVAVRIAPLPDSAMLATKLAPNRRAIVASPDYVDRRGAPERPEDLAGHDCIVQGDMWEWRFQRGGGPEAGGEERRVRVSGGLHTNTGAVVRDAALLGLGIGLKSIWDVGEELRAGRLVRILPDWEFAEMGAIWALRPPGRFVSPRARAFIDFFKAKYGPHPYWEIN